MICGEGRDTGYKFTRTRMSGEDLPLSLFPTELDPSCWCCGRVPSVYYEEMRFLLHRAGISSGEYMVLENRECVLLSHTRILCNFTQSECVVCSCDNLTQLLLLLSFRQCGSSWILCKWGRGDVNHSCNFCNVDRRKRLHLFLVFHSVNLQLYWNDNYNVTTFWGGHRGAVRGAKERAQAFDLNDAKFKPHVKISSFFGSEQRTTLKRGLKHPSHRRFYNVPANYRSLLSLLTNYKSDSK